MSAALLLALPLAAVLAAYLLLPYLERRLPATASPLAWDWRGRAEDLRARQESLRAAVAELRADARAGRVEGAGYERMLQDYREEMARVLQELDLLEEEVDAHIDAQVAARRARLEELDARLEAEVSARRARLSGRGGGAG